ncbi:hypothetical protein HYU22_05380 [Candidatus Woesearchaeota archaeon]|nr:hypothetical protein [Candidatus Woesearchaeota archaeon]
MAPEHKYLAIYFRMGQYEKDDNVPQLVGFDCPFDDSPVLQTTTEAELEFKVKEVYAGTYPFEERCWWGVDWRGIYPEVICDSQGIIQIELYRRICSDPSFDPQKAEYSLGRETLAALWEREKWRWIDGKQSP